MNFGNITPVLLVATLIFSGCSAKSKGFFEDLYSQTEVKSADHFEHEAPLTRERVPSQNSTEGTSLSNIEQTPQTPQVAENGESYQATGVITNVNFDKSLGLYVCTFVKNNDDAPVIFYADKEIFASSKQITVRVKDNFLVETSGLSGASKSMSMPTESPTSHQRTNQKRKPSPIQTPTIEKINTL